MRISVLVVALAALVGCGRDAPAPVPAAAPPDKGEPLAAPAPAPPPARSPGESAAADALKAVLRVNPGNPDPAAPVADAELDLPENKKPPDLAPLAALPHLRKLSLKGFGLNDAVLATLPPLDKLEVLSTSWNRLTDAGVKHLARHVRLREVSLGADVTGKGLADLAGLKELRTLAVRGLRRGGMPGLAALTQLEHLDIGDNNDLSAPPFDRWLGHVRGLTNLRTLRLSQTQVYDEQLDSLSGLVNLEELYFSDARITGGGLKNLAGMTKLRRLDLRSDGLTDAGLKEIGRLGALEMLSVSGAKVTDAGLRELHGLTKLRGLNVSGTKVTAAGLGEFRKAVPGCAVRFNDNARLPFDP